MVLGEPGPFPQSDQLAKDRSIEVIVNNIVQKKHISDDSPVFPMSEYRRDLPLNQSHDPRRSSSDQAGTTRSGGTYVGLFQLDMNEAVFGDSRLLTHIRGASDRDCDFSF